MKKYIYADNAATTAIDENVLQSMQQYLRNEYGNASQPYSFGRTAKKAINDSRSVIASCIGAKAEEIFFTSCGTESDNWVIKNSFPYSSIITSCIEHHAILNACKAVSNNTEVVKLTVDRSGLVSLRDLDEALRNTVDDSRVLVSIMTANNEIGTIQPIKQLAEISHSHGAIFHTDAVQAVGHIKINVDEMGVDMLSASAHKFNGPKGIGFLYVRKGTAISPFIDGGLQENGMRAGTENVASIVGMATALKNNTNMLEASSKYIYELETRLIQRLEASDVEYIRNGSINHIPGNISISFKNGDGEMILHRMDLKGICISTGSACDSVRTQISHVIKSISVDPDYANGTIRISLGKNNTFEEVDTIAKELIGIVHSSCSHK